MRVDRRISWIPEARRTAEPGGGVSHVLCERRRRRRVGFRLGLQRNVEGQQYALPDTTLAS